jgi:hypothetical protein
MRKLKQLLLLLTPMGAAAFVAGGGTFASFAELSRWTPETWAEATRSSGAASLLRTKKSLLAVMLIGIAAYVGFGGTFANFQAETANNGSSIASGTLTMSNTVNSNTACFSYNAASADNTNAGCDAPFAITNVAPGTWQSTQIAKITVANTGSIDGSNLYLYASQIVGKLGTQLTSGSAVSSLTLSSPGMEGTVTNGDSVTISSGGKSQTFTVNAAPTNPSNSNGGATTVSVTSQTANYTYPVGSTVTDTSGNTATTNTNCFDTKTATGASYNFNPITGSTTQQAYNPFCGAVVTWVQELTGGKTYCWFGKGSSYSSGSSLTEDANGRCVAPIYVTLSSTISGTITSLPVNALNGNVASGDSIAVSQGGTTQTFTASAAAPVGSTSISISSTAVSGTFTASTAAVTDTTATTSLDSNATTDTLTNFDTGHRQASGRIELFPISSNGTLSNGVGHASELTSSGSRTFYVGVYLPKPSGSNQNGLQGLSSTFGLTWHLDQ